MKLRRQLLLVSLLTLSLPWAGYQYIQEMAAALRQGQSAALSASAQAVAARLGSEPALLPAVGSSSPSVLEREIYAHPFNAAAIVDGYSDDWRSYNIAPRLYPPAQSTRALRQSTPGVDGSVVKTPVVKASAVKAGAVKDSGINHIGEPSPFAAQLRAGAWGSRLYLFIEVKDPAIHYHHPGKATVASGDHLLLARGRDKRPPLVYSLRTSAPGSIAAVARNSKGVLYREHRIKGSWRERGDGYQVELELPLEFAERGFGVAVVNADNGKVSETVGNYLPVDRQTVQASAALGRVITQPPRLNDEIAVFARPGLRLRVVDNHAWQLAQAGSLAVADPDVPLEASTGNSPWLLTRVYRTILKNTQLPVYGLRHNEGRYHSPEVMQALEGKASDSWYRMGSRQLGSAAVPIVAADGRLLGAVIAEQTSDALLELTNSAFTRLLVLSMGVALLVGAGLLGYASWLSWRIRLLNRAADRAVAGDGQIRGLEGAWPSVAAQDELGELSRGYRDSLTRLQGYTDYLKTLADKLSHELRTPLAVVRSSLDNLEHEDLPSQAGVYTERARSGVERLSRLLTAMSEASRVEASIQGAEREAFPLDELLQNVCAGYRDIYPAQNIMLDIAPCAEGYQYWGAPDLLVQCLDKLMDNAADYCPPGEDIRVRLSKKAKQWQLCVENRGPLLPEHMREQLFDSLVSLRDGNSGGEKAHMGLGLYIVRLVSEFHGGQVSADNLADGSGVVITVGLPIK